MVVQVLVAAGQHPSKPFPPNPATRRTHAPTHTPRAHTHTPAEAAIQTPLYRCGIVRAQERPTAGSPAATHTPRAVTPTAAALRACGRGGCLHVASRRRRGRHSQVSCCCGRSMPQHRPAVTAAVHSATAVHPTPAASTTASTDAGSTTTSTTTTTNHHLHTRQP